MGLGSETGRGGMAFGGGGFGNGGGGGGGPGVSVGVTSSIARTGGFETNADTSQRSASNSVTTSPRCKRQESAERQCPRTSKAVEHQAELPPA